jgi:hypothetical protein
MKMIKPDVNVKYTVEMNNGLFWEELKSFTLIQKAIDYINMLKKSEPKVLYRMIRSEWQVID